MSGLMGHGPFPIASWAFMKIKWDQEINKVYKTMQVQINKICDLLVLAGGLIGKLRGNDF